MKKRFTNILTIVAIAVSVVACKKAKEANTSEAEPAAVAESTSQKYVTDVNASTIEWKGFKPTATHNGTIKIDTGVFQVMDNKLQSGTFLIDMASIEVLDLEGEYKTNLENHLKGTVEGKEGDFFNINQFPSAAFEISSVESLEAGKTMLSGNLTIKGIENNISFPVTVSNEGDKLTISSESFTIDRTKWGVNYGSKSIFDNLGDKFINDEMELKINIVAFKKA
ncbi:YceI family protein [Xanthomarina sp. GH4-25]|uniref:YceI family protein n=1 Tax=Xanthomarina sp. GH4-25 TaxID=3349335 RepID=UPI000D67321F|nr:lipid-binding protein [Flavobacteriaceae bacterium LYZ1037]